MPRPLRIHFPGAFYHATLRGNHQQAIFQIAADRLRLNEIVADALETYGARLHAFCWMTNHLHFLIQVGDEPLGSAMRQIASEYARGFQRKLQTTGHLFERRYHARIVNVESYLLALLRYIHMNPVSAGIVKRPYEYRWSSHHGYAGTESISWLTTDFVLAMLAPDRGDAMAAYLRYMDCTADEVTDPLVESAPHSGAGAPGAARTASMAGTPPQTLEKLIDEACHRFNTTLEQLHSDSRDVYLMQVRGWIAKCALERRIANLSQIARALGRDRATLRHAIGRIALEAS